jgi:hypothetical protein
MSIKLTNTQLALLGAASQREDTYLAPPTGPRLGPAKRAASKLLTEGLVQEVRARKDAPVWRRDEDSDQAFALKLTAAGLKAIARGGDEQQEAAGERSSSNAVESEAMPGGVDARDAGAPVEAIKESAWPRVPRAGTKISNVIELLEQDSGVTIDEIIAITGWLPHTSRAALTGLRKRGYALVSDRSDRTRSTVYRIACRETGDEAINAAIAGSDREGGGDTAPSRKRAAADRRRRRAS